jgi:hypothetical protein
MNKHSCALALALAAAALVPLAASSAPRAPGDNGNCYAKDPGCETVPMRVAGCQASLHRP